jgi:hypothetical protein
MVVETGTATVITTTMAETMTMVAAAFLTDIQQSTT